MTSGTFNRVAPSDRVWENSNSPPHDTKGADAMQPNRLYFGDCLEIMKDAAVNAGQFHKWPVLQIYTVEDYFAERKPDLPLAA